MGNSTFFEDVYEVVRLVPKGRVTSYGAIAHYLGAKSSARMVGWALNATPSDSVIPVHRVVNRTGQLTGRHHFNPPTQMQTLLEQEGIVVLNHQVQNFDELFWKPTEELEE